MAMCVSFVCVVPAFGDCGILIEDLSEEYYTLYPDKKDFIDSVISDYLNSEVFIEHYNTNPEGAIEILNTALKYEIDMHNTKTVIEPFASTPVGPGNNPLFYCYVDSSIIQEEKTWCGVASTLMALTGIEKYAKSDLVSGYKRPTQSAIAGKVIPKGDDTAWVYLITEYLNSQLKNNKYVYKKINSYVSKDNLKQYIYTSLLHNRPVILSAKPYASISYYIESKYNYLINGAHYLVVEAYNSYTDTFTISDCTYLEDDNIVLQGQHDDITLDEIYDSVDQRNIVYG